MLFYFSFNILLRNLIFNVVKKQKNRNTPSWNFPEPKSELSKNIFHTERLPKHKNTQKLKSPSGFFTADSHWSCFRRVFESNFLPLSKVSLEQHNVKHTEGTRLDCSKRFREHNTSTRARLTRWGSFSGFSETRFQCKKAGEVQGLMQEESESESESESASSHKRRSKPSELFPLAAEDPLKPQRVRDFLKLSSGSAFTNRIQSL